MGKLVLVPTPIGNLEDITLRAITVLKNADVVLAEDTRKSSILLNHFEIKAKLKPYHMFNEHKSLDSVVDLVLKNELVALITDAGTPAISDPGFLLVRECLKFDIEIETLPGAVAFVPALVNSGLPSDRFCFEGFLPTKKGRKTKLETLALEERTIIFYESPYRLIKTLKQMAEYFGEERNASVSRELTKMYEENVQGTLVELVEYFEAKSQVKGEIVIVVGGNVKSKEVK